MSKYALNINMMMYGSCTPPPNYFVSLKKYIAFLILYCPLSVSPPVNFSNFLLFQNHGVSIFSALRCWYNDKGLSSSLIFVV